MNIVFFGDSITDCGRSRDEVLPNLELGQGYVNLIASRLLFDNPSKNLKFFNRGISGNKATDGLARIENDLLSLKPDVVNILFGINGVWHEFMSGSGITAKVFESAYREILDSIFKQNPDAFITLMEPYSLYFGKADISWKNDVDERIEIVNTIAKDYKLPLIPLQKMFNEKAQVMDKLLLLKDGVHPAPAGHQMIADSWISLFTRQFL